MESLELTHRAHEAWGLVVCQTVRNESLFLVISTSETLSWQELNWVELINWIEKTSQGLKTIKSRQAIILSFQTIGCQNYRTYIHHIVRNCKKVVCPLCPLFSALKENFVLKAATTDSAGVRLCSCKHSAKHSVTKYLVHGMDSWKLNVGC